jgi:enolase
VRGSLPLAEKGNRASGGSTAVGDEGGFAPNLKKDEDALKLIVEAVEKAGFVPGKDFLIAMDAASSEWYREESGDYYLPKSKKTMSRQQMVAMWKNFASKYPIISLEDGMGETDMGGLVDAHRALGGKIQLVGDDLFVTMWSAWYGNRKRGGQRNSHQGKPDRNPDETLDAIQMANRAGYTPSCPTFRRDGGNHDRGYRRRRKRGADQDRRPLAHRRVAKYNQLLRIEEELGAAAHTPERPRFSISGERSPKQMP